MEKREQGQPKETNGETSRKTLKPDNRQREQATRSQSKGREGRGSNSLMQKSNSAEKNRPKRKRTARQLKQEQHGTNALLRAWRGRTGGQKKDSKRTRGGRVRGGGGAFRSCIYGPSGEERKVHPAIHKYQTKGRISLDNFRRNQQDQVVPKTCLIYCYVLFINCIWYCDQFPNVSHAHVIHTLLPTTPGYKEHTLYRIVGCVYIHGTSFCLLHEGENKVRMNKAEATYKVMSANV